MKNQSNKVLLASMTMAMCLASCEKDDTGYKIPDYKGMVCTVTKDADNGSCLMLEDASDAYLESRDWGMLNDLNMEDGARVFISYDFVGNVEKPEAGQTYKIKLDSQLGLYGNIPTYTEPRDLSKATDAALVEKSRALRYMNMEGAKPYLANGFLNIYPSFVFNPAKEVHFALAYDFTKPLSEDGKLECQLYFTNSFGVSQEEFIGEFLISLKMPENVYQAAIAQGKGEEDDLEIVLSAKTSTGTETITIKSKVKDLHRP